MIASMLARFQTDKMQSEQRLLGERRLASQGYKAYSEGDQDGIIQEIFRRIGVTNKFFVEFGCGDGLQNNTLYLLLGGWKGVWMDGNPRNHSETFDRRAQNFGCRKYQQRYIEVVFAKRG